MVNFDFDLFSSQLRANFVSSDTVLYTVRLMFKFKGSDVVNFKIITDTVDGIEKFILSLSKVEDIVSLAYEYLSEYNCNLLGLIKNVFNLEV